MYETEIEYMDLAVIACSGQCFRIKRRGEEVWSVTARDQYVEVRQAGKRFAFSCSGEEWHDIWREYFDLDTDYGAVRAAVDPADAYLSAAAEFGGGMRILRQDLWEMIVTFLISQNNNISRIRGSIEAMSERLGRRLTGRGFDGEREYCAFPEPEAIAGAGVEGLKGLGLGYRDKYIHSIAVTCRDGEWLERLRGAGYREAAGLLTEQFGIGKKVADCVCLFGLHHVDVFPVDTHIRQILEKYYPSGFPLERYQGYAGILQQYLFYYKRNGEAHL